MAPGFFTLNYSHLRSKTAKGIYTSVKNCSLLVCIAYCIDF
jgi:hypothetical protein